VFKIRLCLGELREIIKDLCLNTDPDIIWSKLLGGKLNISSSDIKSFVRSEGLDDTNVRALVAMAYKKISERILVTESSSWINDYELIQELGRLLDEISRKQLDRIQSRQFGTISNN
jgi:hypothetical protein